MVIYSIDQETVEPVFYPVVPDSFMNRESNGTSATAASGGIELAEAFDSVIVTPRDPWSF